MAHWGRFGKVPNFADLLVRNYRSEIYRLKGRTLRGLISAQRHIFESMDSQPPTIPVDTGNMRSSYFCVTSNGAVIKGASPHFSDKRKDAGKLSNEHGQALSRALAKAQKDKARGPNIVFGFSAYYTVWVHAMREPEFHFSHPGSGGDFFTAALERTKNVVLKIIGEEAKIKR